MTLLLEEAGLHKYQEGKGVLLGKEPKVKMIRVKASKPLRCPTLKIFNIRNHEGQIIRSGHIEDRCERLRI
jgi:hypothetical protein